MGVSDGSGGGYGGGVVGGWHVEINLNPLAVVKCVCACARGSRRTDCINSAATRLTHTSVCDG